MFCRKLDCIMELTQTTNSDLSRKLPLSPSYICRLRSGKRKLPKVAPFLPNLAEYFVKKLKEKDWVTLGFEEVPDFKEKDLMKWFLERDENLLSEKNMESKRLFDFYFGEEGKRLLVLQFFEDVLKCEKKQTLFLYSSENVAWLISDPFFFNEWQKILIKILEKGNSIVIVHNFNRNLHEMYKSIEKWIPVYMTGKIEPYFCNYLRDGIFQQSFFIAPESGAIVSSSVKNDTEKMPNFYFRSTEIIDALIREYNNFLKISTPFLTCYHEYNRFLEDFFLDEDSIYSSNSGFSLATLPKEIVNVMDDNYIKFWKGSVSKFQNTIKNNKVVEICQLHTPEEIQKGVLLPFSGLLGFKRVFYTEKSYIIHLQNIIKLLSENENYDFQLHKKDHFNQSYLIKQDKEILICDNLISPFIFRIKRFELTSSIWDLLNLNIRISGELTKDEMIETLKKSYSKFNDISNNL